MIVGASSQGSYQLRSNEFFKIHIKHIPTSETVTFEGFVTQFSDTYTAQWNEEQVYGRMDPLATYQGTKRNITLGFDIPNDSKVMSIFNMRRIQKLIQFMYPVYDSGDLSTQNVLTAAPLLTLKWTNLISSVNNEGQELVGYINGPISYAPDVAEGGFMSPEITQHATPPGQTYEGAARGETANAQQIKKIRNYFPKKISMNFNFTVLHTHLLGWTATGVVEDWGDASESFIETAKAAGHGAKHTTTTYSFGGSNEVASRFPNIYKSPPPPSNPPQQGEEQLQADYAAAEEQAADLAAPEFVDNNGVKIHIQEVLNEQNRQRLGADANAYVDEILSDRGGRDGGVETYVDEETGLKAVRFAGGDG